MSKEKESVLQQVPKEGVMCFTDGSCLGNPGPCGSAAAVFIKNEKKKKPIATKTKCNGQGTNQIAELVGFQLGFELVSELLESKNLLQKQDIYMFSDSRYAIGLLTLGWKAKANVELVELLRERMESISKQYDITWKIQWIPAHTGIAENEYVDKLAKAAAASEKKSIISS